MKYKTTTRKLTVAILLVLIVIAGIIYVINQSNSGRVLQYPLDSSYGETGAYVIDSKTILDNLGHGKMDVFEPSNATPSALASTGLVSWKQSDYLEVAGALHRFVWKEDLTHWQLYSLYFYRGCQDNPKAFESAKITYFKPTNAFLNYTTHMINIDLIRDGVSWGGNANFPRPLLGWRSINLRELMISADDALQMGEENGGRDARLKVQNICTVDIILSPNTDSGSVWRITYYSDTLATGDSVIFNMQVNPYTGNYQILKGK